MNKLLLITIILALSNAGVLLTNGDFERELTMGWQQTHSSANYLIDRNTIYDPDPNYEVQVYQGTGAGYTMLYQTVEIPTTDLEFSVNAKLYAYDNHVSAWTGAAVVISYLDGSGALLGDTRICARSTQCPWTDTPTCHIIEAIDSLWHNYHFGINSELVNLPGVEPSNIKKIRVALFDSTYHC